MALPLYYWLNCILGVQFLVPSADTYFPKPGVTLHAFPYLVVVDFYKGLFGWVANSQPDFRWPPSSRLNVCRDPPTCPWLCSHGSLAWLCGNARIGRFHGARLSQAVPTQHCVSNHSLLPPLTSFPHVRAATP